MPETKTKVLAVTSIVALAIGVIIVAMVAGGGGGTPSDAKTYWKCPSGGVGPCDVVTDGSTTPYVGESGRMACNSACPAPAGTQWGCKAGLCVAVTPTNGVKPIPFIPPSAVPNCPPKQCGPNPPAPPAQTYYNCTAAGSKTCAPTTKVSSWPFTAAYPAANVTRKANCEAAKPCGANVPITYWNRECPKGDCVITHVGGPLPYIPSSTGAAGKAKCEAVKPKCVVPAGNFYNCTNPGAILPAFPCTKTKTKSQWPADPNDVQKDAAARSACVAAKPCGSGKPIQYWNRDCPTSETCVATNVLGPKPFLPVAMGAYGKSQCEQKKPQCT